jgi:hypothetical protein
MQRIDVARARYELEPITRAATSSMRAVATAAKLNPV